MELKQKSVIIKLIRLFLLILFPIIIIGLFSLVFANRRLEHEILQSALSSTDQFAARFDYETGRTHELAASLLEHDRVLRLSNPQYQMSIYEYLTNINILRDLLTNIKISNPTLFNVRVYFERRERIVNANHYRYGSLQDLDSKRYESILALHQEPNKIHLDNERLVMLMASFSKKPMIIIETEFDVEEMSRQFASNLMYNDSDYMFLLNDGNYLNSSNQNPEMIDLIQKTQDAKEPISKILYQGEHYYIFWADLPIISGSWCQIIPAKILTQPMQNSQAFTIVFTCIVLLCTALFFIGANKIIHRPMRSLVQAFEGIQHGDFNVRIEDMDTSEFEYLYQSFNRMAKNLDQVIQQNYRHTLLLQKAELKQLQTQINPHFLYNSFFLLRNMIEQRMTEESKAVASLLGRYFQYITRDSLDMVPLRDELEHALLYLQIQEKRFADRVSIQIEEIPPDYENIMVPKLILQPIVENAFDYGMESKEEKGLISISFFTEGNDLLILIEDNGDELSDKKLSEIKGSLSMTDSPDTEKEVTGLVNIYRRLTICYSREDALEISRSSLGGMCVSIRLAIHEVEKDVYGGVQTPNR